MAHKVVRPVLRFPLSGIPMSGKEPAESPSSAASLSPRTRRRTWLLCFCCSLATLVVLSTLQAVLLTQNSNSAPTHTPTSSATEWNNTPCECNAAGHSATNHNAHQQPSIEGSRLSHTPALSALLQRQRSSADSTTSSNSQSMPSASSSPSSNTTQSQPLKDGSLQLLSDELDGSVYFQLPYSCPDEPESPPYVAQPALVVYNAVGAVFDHLNSPQTRRELCKCLSLVRTFSIVPGVSWGSAKQSQWNDWRDAHCDDHTIMRSSLNSLLPREGTYGTALQLMRRVKAEEDAVRERYALYWEEEERKRKGPAVAMVLESERKGVTEVDKRKWNNPLKAVTVVAAKHTEDIQWLTTLDRYRFHVVMGVKPRARTYDIPVHFEIMQQKHNIGDEATVFLQYILQNYRAGTFSPHVAFIHSHETSWHQQSSMRLRLQTFRFGTYPFMSLNYDMYMCYPLRNLENDHPLCYHAFEKLLLPHLPEYHAAFAGGIGNHSVCHHCCAQFVTSRERILSRPYALYEAALHFFDPLLELESNRSAAVEAYGERAIWEVEQATSTDGRIRANAFEFIWHLIFGEPLQETKLPMCMFQGCKV